MPLEIPQLQEMSRKILDDIKEEVQYTDTPSDTQAPSSLLTPEPEVLRWVSPEKNWQGNKME